MQKKYASSITAYLESIILTSVTDDKADRYVATKDIPNFFIYTPIDVKPVEEKIKVRITGVLVNMLVKMDLGKYCPSVVYEKVKKVL